MTETVTVNPQHKDRLFRKLFNDKKVLLSLYNAMNDTAYENPEDLTITTLENVIYMKAKNDISFAVEGTMNLYEHQSTFNPNMPLRGLFYLCDLLRGYVAGEDLDMYASKPIELPFPKYAVFYNGNREMPDLQELYLRDAFRPQGKNGENPALDVTCTMVNINQGHNKELMEHCPLLGEYSRFISSIKGYIQENFPLAEAVRNAMDFCIRDGVLSEFLKQHREEAFHMILEEYNEELHKRTEAAYWKEVGLEKGMKEGMEKGMEKGRKEGIEITKKVLRLSAQGITPGEIAGQLEISLDMVQQILE